MALEFLSCVQSALLLEHCSWTPRHMCVCVRSVLARRANFAPHKYLTPPQGPLKLNRLPGRLLNHLRYMYLYIVSLFPDRIRTNGLLDTAWVLQPTQLQRRLVSSAIYKVHTWHLSCMNTAHNFAACKRLITIKRLPQDTKIKGAGGFFLCWIRAPFDWLWQHYSEGQTGYLLNFFLLNLV